MKKGIIKSILAATAMLVSANLALAAEVTVTTPDVKGALADTKAAAKATKETAKGKAADTKAAAKDAKESAKGKVADTKAAAKGAVADSKAAAKDAKDAAKAKVADTKAAAKSAVKAPVIDINTASEAELKAIPGIGDAYAAKIIAGRPYSNKSQLKSRNILPAVTYEQVSNQIIAKKVAATAAKPVKK